jgi:glycosyltransferase involved in cell wall biosynthesis
MNAPLMAEESEAVRATPLAAAPLSRAKRRLLFLLPYPLDSVPGQRLKFEQYFSTFEQAGYEVQVRCFFDEAFYKLLYLPGRSLRKILWTLRSYRRRWQDLREVKADDVAYVHLWVAPFHPPLFEWVLRRRVRGLIYDIDDLIFLRRTSRANRWIKGLKGTGNVHYLMRVSDHVIVCTEYLKTYASQFNPHVTNISSTINTEVYRARPKLPSRTRLCIGWSGSHSTVEYVALLQRVFEELRQRYGFYIKIIGHTQPPLTGLEVVAQDWKRASEVEDLQEFDIGVYPLPSDPWVLGKSGLKALQYMSLGIPTVATAIGATQDIIQDGANGFLASSHHEWVEKLARLLGDPVLRQRIGVNARKTVEARYSVRSNAQRYLEILARVDQVTQCPPGLRVRS